METPTKPAVYDAHAEYMKEVDRNRKSGNIPARVMREAQHAMVEALQNNLVVKASMHPGFSSRVEKWRTLSEPEKFVLAGEMRDPDELKAAIIVEDDTNMIRFLSDRIDEVRKENETGG